MSELRGVAKSLTHALREEFVRLGGNWRPFFNGKSRSMGVQDLEVAYERRATHMRGLATMAQWAEAQGCEHALHRLRFWASYEGQCRPHGARPPGFAECFEELRLACQDLDLQ